MMTHDCIELELIISFNLIIVAVDTDDQEITGLQVNGIHMH